MTDYAYQVWLCGECDSHCIEMDDGTLLCETCGSRYECSMGHTAPRLPDEDDDADD